MQIKRLRGRILKTVVLFFSYICMGLYNEVIGPSLPDIRIYHGLSNEGISRALSLGCGGMFAGSLIGGFVIDRYPSHRFVSLSVIMGIATATIGCLPFCEFVWQLTATMVILGMSQGLQSSGVGPVLVDLWSYKATGPLSLIHGGYFTGFALAPVLISLFLSASQRSDSHPAGKLRNWSATPDNLTLGYRHAIPSHIVYSYLAITALCGACCVAFIIIAVYEQLRRVANKFDDNDDASLRDLALKSRARRRSSTFVETWRVMAMTRSQAGHIVGLLVVLFFLFFSSLGGDRLMCRFIYTYVSEGPLKFERKEAYLFNMMVGIAYAVSRFGIVFLSAFVNAEHMLIVLLLGSSFFSIVMTAVVTNSAGFWSVAAIFCLFKGPIHPTSIGVFNRYVPVSGLVQLVINAGSGIGAMFVLWLCGYLVDQFGFQCFTYILITTSVMTAVGGILVVVLGRRLRTCHELTVHMEE